MSLVQPGKPLLWSVCLLSCRLRSVLLSATVNPAVLTAAAAPVVSALMAAHAATAVSASPVLAVAKALARAAAGNTSVASRSIAVSVIVKIAAVQESASKDPALGSTLAGMPRYEVIHDDERYSTCPEPTQSIHHGLGRPRGDCRHRRAHAQRAGGHAWPRRLELKRIYVELPAEQNLEGYGGNISDILDVSARRVAHKTNIFLRVVRRFMLFVV